MTGIPKYLNLLLVLVAVLQIHPNDNVHAVTLGNNGYTLNIAISSQVSRIPEDQRANFLQNIRVSLNNLLFKKLDN